MKQSIMHIFTRTPLHVGAGNSVGVVDSPIQREKHTKIPIIPGSILKGVLSDFWNDENFKRNDQGKIIFGNDDPKNASAGNLLVGEARVLAFPVRSAKGAFAWITCPLVLARYKRDSNADFDISKFDGLKEDQCLITEESLINFKKDVILEEYKFSILESVSPSVQKISEELKKANDDEVWATVENRLVIVSDEIFSYFVENACEVVSRICVDDETGVTKKGALFNQEQCPSETMFYAVMGEQKDKGSLNALADKLKEKEIGNIIQVGANERAAGRNQADRWTPGDRCGTETPERADATDRAEP